MYLYIYVYRCKYICIFVNICTNMYLDVNMCIYKIYMYIHEDLYMCINAYTGK